jgi:hypothetical protein
MRKKWFIVVEYLKCPYCHTVFDPKGLKKEIDIDDDDEEEVIACRFCHQKAPINLGIREKRIL